MDTRLLLQKHRRSFFKEYGAAWIFSKKTGDNRDDISIRHPYGGYLLAKTSAGTLPAYYPTTAYNRNNL